MPKRSPQRKQQKKHVEGMRNAGKLARQILTEVRLQVVAGMSTYDIDVMVDKLTEDAGARSGPYLYGRRDNPFPMHCCTSVNEVVCHGIPSKDVILKDGDIVNIDVTPVLAGYHGDTSCMVEIGEVSKEARQLVTVAYFALYRGIEACYPNCPVTVIADAIQPFVEAEGFSVVQEYTGHGIGKTFHKAPSIFHCRFPEAVESEMKRLIYGGEIPLLKPGMAFTIEPMINAGSHETESLEDGWTVVTKDRKLSAQWEHTLLMTKNGVEVLTE